MVDFIDQRIGECRSKLHDIHKQIDALRLRAASIEGELRAYESVRKQSLGPTKTVVVNTADKDVARNAAPQKTADIRKSRLSPTWKAIFTDLVAAYPASLSRARIEEIGKQIAPLGDSFRTALWHHVNRGYVDEVTEGQYRANSVTAYRAGLPWVQPGPDKAKPENEFSLGEGSP